MKKLFFYLSITLLFTNTIFGQITKNPTEKIYKEIQFTQLPSLAEQTAWQKEGIELIEYLQNKTYIIHTTNENLNRFLSKNSDKISNTRTEKNASQNDKIAPILKTYPTNQEIEVQFVVYKNAEESFITKQLQNYRVEFLKYYPELGIVKGKGQVKNIINLAENSTWLQYVSIPSIPTILNLPGKSNSRSSALDFGARNLTGNGINMGIWDGTWTGVYPNSIHIDFTGRFNYGEIPVNQFFAHGIHVTGTMAGAGNRNPYIRGMAAEAKIFSYTLNSGDYITAEMFQAVRDNNVTITQNSYGSAQIFCPQGAPYDTDDRTRDQLVNTFPNLLHVFAIGNAQAACLAAGSPFGSTASNTGKNTLTVGSVDAADNLSNTSSFGPSRDGRIKPDVTAVGVSVNSTAAGDNYLAGQSGTSMACPVVSGIAAQIYQRYKQLFANVNPPAALVKAVICNGARDLGNVNPDYKFGFGRVNAVNAVLALEENRFIVDKTSQGVTKTYMINVPAGVPQIKVLLTWSDIASPVTSGVALINNLDLQVSDGITSYNPWVLDPNNRNNVAVRGVDNLNNIEQVTIDTPTAGTYQITVSGAAVPMGEQEFALTWQMDTPFVRVMYPAGSEKLTQNTAYIIYWDSNLSSGTYDVEYSIDNGMNWNTIVTGLANTVNHVNWTTPNITTNQALVRVTNTSVSGSSASNFTLLNVPTITVASGANNSATLTWSAVTGATGYDIMLLNQTTGVWSVFQSNLAVTTTTITNLINNQTYWFSVRARQNAIESERAYAYPITPTGVGISTAEDLSLTAISAPTTATSCVAKTNTENVTITIRNNGTTTLLSGTMLPVSYQINSQNTVNEVVTLSSHLLANATTSYTFTQKADLSVSGNYKIDAQVNLQTDLVTTNNSNSISISNPVFPANPTISGTLSVCAGTTTLTATTPINSYKITNIPFSPINASSGTALILGDDEATTALSLGFSFKFFEKTYTAIYVGSNGLAGFTDFAIDGASLPSTIPNSTSLPNNFIAFAWADLAPNFGGTIRYLQTGTAPNRKFIIDFNNVPFYANPTVNRVTTQIIVNENNTIEIHTSNTNAGANTVMGVEGELGNVGVAVTGRNNTVWSASNEGLLFSPQTEGFAWLPNGETTSSITASTAGNYTVSYTQNSCTYTQTATVTDCIMYVRKNGNDANNGATNDAAGAKLTVQNAVDNSIDGGKIVIDSGTYNENITATNKNLSIKGVGNPILQTLIMNGIGKNITLTGGISLSELVNLQAGNLISNGNLTLLSTATKQAMVINNGNSIISGNVTIQRYFRNNTAFFPTATNGVGYRHLSSPVNAANFTQLTDNFSVFVNPNFNTASRPGTVLPFPTIYFYDGTKAGDATKTFVTSPTPAFDKGWASPNAITDNFVLGKGYSVNTSASQIVDMTGVLNNSPAGSNITIPITTGNISASLGWNLIGNPYPSPISWAALRAMTNPAGILDAAIYLYTATSTYQGSFATNIPSMGISNPMGAVTDNIAVMQGFFVKANANGNVIFDNSIRSTSYTNPNSFRTEDNTNLDANSDKNHNGIIRLKMTNTKNEFDETVIYFTEKATNLFDNQYDAYKFQLNGGTIPSIYSTDNKDLYAINALKDLKDDLIIPLLVNVGFSGKQKISLLQQTGFNRKVELYLLDKTTNITYDLSKGAYEFVANLGIIKDRFYLLAKPQFTESELNGDILNLYPNPTNEMLTISLADDYKGEISLRLVDMLGREVWKENLIKDNKIYQTTINLSGKASGTYLLEVVGSQKVVKKVIKQ